MACEIPVIGSDSGEIPNVIGEAGLVFREEGTHDLAAKLMMLISDKGFRELLHKERVESESKKIYARTHCHGHFYRLSEHAEMNCHT